MSLMRLKIDLHVHSYYSDGLGTPEDILEHAMKKSINGLAITDHSTLEGYFRARELDSDLLIIPGFEVATAAGYLTY
ncbi:putative metal-dependent phosphoesterase, PHP family [Thaumarchaeota archaeon SCGC AB-539-E09]|nr:putative metal-dependent phosphoesterase, PHP family [Thaumarchaeota archaeon SCGC AB-539-E09]